MAARVYTYFEVVAYDDDAVDDDDVDDDKHSNLVSALVLSCQQWLLF